MATFDFKLPDIGEGVVEGEIVKWLVKVGDDIALDQPLVEVMTDKATVAIPSPRAGRVVRMVGAEGEITKVHATLVVLDLAAVEGTPVGGEEKASANADAEAKADTKSSANAIPAAPIQDKKVLASPVTRKMAAEHKVNLANLVGSGPQGRVMKADLEAHLQAPSAGRPPAPTPLAADEVRPLKGLRRSIAKSMALSHTHVVPFTFVEECETLALTALRGRINEQLAKDGHGKLSYLPFLTKALVKGFARYPELNAVMDEAGQALIVKKEHNIGFGAATAAGLTVFVVRDVAHKSIRQLGGELDRLAKAARENKLTLAELSGGTFTVTSLGKDGGLMATPVVKHPEVAILGVHKIKEYPRVVRDAEGKAELEIGEHMNLSCSFDHRVIDGHIGAAFLYEVIRALQAPESLLID